MEALEYEDEVFVSEAELRALDARDIPAGSHVGIGKDAGGHVEVEFDGYLTASAEGVLTVYVAFEAWPKYWYSSLGARQHLELLRKSVEARAVSVGDVRLDDYSDEDDVRISLTYQVTLPPSFSPYDAVIAARRVQADVDRPVEHILSEVDRSLARAAQALVQGEFLAMNDLLLAVERSDETSVKGKALEALVAAAMQKVPGFYVSERNLRTATEEIDLLVINGNEGPLFRKEGPLILVECKNWSRRTPRVEVSALEGKIRNRRGRCTVAYFVSWLDLSSDGHRELLRMSRENYVIAPVNGTQLRGAIGQGDAAVVDLLEAAYLHAVTS